MKSRGRGFLTDFISELKRRNVFRVAAAYAVTAWIVIQVGVATFPALGVPDWVLTGIIALAALGFPLSLVISWFYELTPEGLMTSEAADAAGYAKPPAFGRQIDFVIILLMAIAIGWLVWRQEAGPVAPDKSIAVLPFVAMSSGKDDGFFADGLTEELLNSLAKISDLKVAGRTSSFYFKGKTSNFQEVGAALGVAHVLEGSVRRDGDKLRITAQLIQASDGFHLWTETYDRTLDDIFAIQEDIAEQVTAALRVAILGEEAARLTAHGTTNAEAQSLYLIAIAKLRESDTFGSDRSLSAGFFAPARRALEQAVELDPAFAKAWAALSRAYRALRVNVTTADGESLSFAEGNRLAREAADRALALAPNLPEALFAKGVVTLSLLPATSASGVAPGRALIDRAMALAPENVDFLKFWANILAIRYKDYEGAIALYDRALAVDPLSTLRLDRANALVLDGRAVEARTEYMRISELYPEAPWKTGIALIEVDRGHLHHYILWDAENFGLALSPYAWASLGHREKALELWRGFGAAGGQVAMLVELGTFVLERDYQGLRDRLENNPEIAEGFFPGSLQLYKFRAAYYLRDWPNAMAHWDQYLLEAPGSRETLFGTPGGRARMPLRITRDQQHFAITNGSIVHAYNMAGRAEEAQTIGDWTLELTDWESDKTHFWQQEMHLARALLYSSNGQTGPALDELEAAYDSGWRWLMGGKMNASFPGDNGWLEDNPALDNIRDEPRFIAVIEKIKADNARMLAELNAGLTLEDIMDEE